LLASSNWAFTVQDDGLTWKYASRIDVVAAMEAKVGEGPCEPALVVLADGRVMTALRLSGGIPLWQAYSSDNGGTWTVPVPMQGKAAATGKAMVPYAVWPQLLRLSNGVLCLASGRPGIGFWLDVSPKSDGTEWMGYDVEAEHDRELLVSVRKFQCIVIMLWRARELVLCESAH
jgi:hypothetical protein